MKLAGFQATFSIFSFQISASYLSDLLEVIVAFLQCPCSVQTLAHATVLVQENFAVLLHPVQHLWDGEVETGGGIC